MFLNSFLVALSLLTTNTFRFPSLKRQWRSYSYCQMMISFIHFFRSKMQDFRLVMTPHVALFLQWWQNLGGTQQEHRGVHSEGNASGFTFTMLVFFLTSILYSKTTTTLEENLMTESDFFFFFFSPRRMFQGLIGTQFGATNYQQRVVPLPGSLLSLCNSTERLAAGGAQLLWLKTKSPA